MDIVKATKGTALPLEIDYNQTAMCLPPVTSAVNVIAKSFWENVAVSEMPLQPFRELGVCGMYVIRINCDYVGNSLLHEV
jgi:hypothetical protein